MGVSERGGLQTCSFEWPSIMIHHQFFLGYPHFQTDPNGCVPAKKWGSKPHEDTILGHQFPLKQAPNSPYLSCLVSDVAFWVVSHVYRFERKLH